MATSDHEPKPGQPSPQAPDPASSEPRNPITAFRESIGENPPTKIRLTDPSEATGETAAAYDFWRAGSGRKEVPGIIKCFGARPDFLKQVVEFSNTVHFSEGHLSRRYKEMIASHVSFLNRCPY
ncbi:MAG: carboxymuconolactone decarboxylase family protein [Candidatus Acidiferrales bacterium]